MPSQSIYSECRTAALDLLEDPRARIATKGPPGIFTELDVIFLAARSHDGGTYSADQMKLAQREASQVMGTMFRNRQIVRFGPVVIPALKEGDYVRFKGKIVYAAPTGPDKLDTPNGVFNRMFVHEDSITRQGRRTGVASRTDFEPWEDQNIGQRRAPAKPTTAQEREITRLKTELEAAHERLRELENENARLREHAAGTVTRADVESLIADALRGGRKAA